MEEICVGCRKPNADSQCGVCGGGVCRKCRVFLSEEEFLFAPDRPDDLKRSCYCGQCFGEKVEPFKAEYENTLERAKQIFVIYKNSKSIVRVLRKAKNSIRVEDRVDRDDAVLSLAFVAARDGYNAIIEVEVTSKKIRNEGYQTTSWSAQGVPAEIRSHGMNF